MAPRRRIVSDPESVPGDTGPRAGRWVRPPGLPGRQDHRTRLTVKRGITALTQGQMCCAASGQRRFLTGPGNATPGLPCTTDVVRPARQIKDCSARPCRRLGDAATVRTRRLVPVAALSHAHERYNRLMQYYPIATSLLGAVKARGQLRLRGQRGAREGRGLTTRDPTWTAQQVFDHARRNA